MKRARLERGPSTDEGTFGTLTLLDPIRHWPTLELPWRGNQRNMSCIRADTLIARLVHSPKFGRNVYRLENKNGREDVEIHVLNFAGDAAMGWKSQAHGCIGLGLKVGTLDNGEGAHQAAVLQSARALDELIEAAKGEDIEIEVAWAEGVAPADNPNPDAHSIARARLQGSAS